VDVIRVGRVAAVLAPGEALYLGSDSAVVDDVAAVSESLVAVQGELPHVLGKPGGGDAVGVDVERANNALGVRAVIARVTGTAMMEVTDRAICTAITVRPTAVDLLSQLNEAFRDAPGSSRSAGRLCLFVAASVVGGWLEVFLGWPATRVLRRVSLLPDEAERVLVLKCECIALVSHCLLLSFARGRSQAPDSRTQLGSCQETRTAMSVVRGRRDCIQSVRGSCRH
jgi:hypothetical protein